MSKSLEIESFLEDFAGRSTALSGKKCLAPPLGCGGDATKFRDELSAREYEISGFCQACQDLVFGGEEALDIDTDICHEPYVVDAGKSDVIKEAVAKGLVVFDATEAVGTIISLDLDRGSDDALALHQQCAAIFGEGIFKGLLVQSKNHATKGSKHGYVYVGLNELTPNVASYITKQLGSDEVREGLSLDYYLNLRTYGHPGSYLMFETPEAAVEIRNWLKTLPRRAQRQIKEVTE